MGVQGFGFMFLGLGLGRRFGIGVKVRTLEGREYLTMRNYKLRVLSSQAYGSSHIIGFPYYSSLTSVPYRNTSRGKLRDWALATAADAP